MRVCVIGCGPAGLAAAHAAYGLGASVTIYSPGVKSPQAGPLLLQRPIPDITTGHPNGYIRQIVIGGSILDYRYKLYGDINININGDMLAEGYHAWDHYNAYDTMWRLYMGNDPDFPDENWNGRAHRVDRMITNLALTELHSHADLVVCTAPRDKICYQPLKHRFDHAKVAITPRGEYPGQPDDTIVFNAGDEYGWVRSSRIFGREVTEWLPGTDMGDNYAGRRIIRKPIGTDCNCYPHVMFTGRFGAWKNEVWVDTAYYDTRDAIISMSRKADWDSVR
jgi:hypothetical protein